MELDAHLTRLAADGVLLEAAAASAAIDAPVPSCPGWRVSELLRHVGTVHRWAAAHVATASPTPLEQPSEAEVLARGPAVDALLEWYKTGLDELVATLRGADPDVACWTFLAAPSPLAFWARRQAHETAVHRVDAELAAGRRSSVEPAFAADGVDELLTGFAPRGRTRSPFTAARSLSVRAIDTEDAWHLELGPDGVRSQRGREAADCTVEGRAEDCYLVLWNRRAIAATSVAVAGDASVLDAWRDGMQVRWT